MAVEERGARRTGPEGEKERVVEAEERAREGGRERGAEFVRVDEVGAAGEVDGRGGEVAEVVRDLLGRVIGEGEEVAGNEVVGVVEGEAGDVNGGGDEGGVVDLDEVGPLLGDGGERGGWAPSVGPEDGAGGRGEEVSQEGPGRGCHGPRPAGRRRRRQRGRPSRCPSRRGNYRHQTAATSTRCSDRARQTAA